MASHLPVSFGVFHARQQACAKRGVRFEVCLLVILGQLLQDLVVLQEIFSIFPHCSDRFKLVVLLGYPHLVPVRTLAEGREYLVLVLEALLHLLDGLAGHFDVSIAVVNIKRTHYFNFKTFIHKISF